MNKGERFHLLLSGDFPPVVGGESRYLYSVFHCLPTTRKAVITPHVSGDRQVDSSLSFRVRRICAWRKGPPKLLSPLIYFFALLAFRKEKLLIHCGQVMIPGLTGLLAKFILGIPYVVYAHGAEFLKYARFPQGTILRAVFKHADKVIANSRYTAGLAKKLGIAEERIIHTLLGVDTRNFHPSPPDPAIIKKYGLEGKRVIVTTCRLVDHKGIDMVIHALPRVLREADDIMYLVVGSGEDLERLERIVVDERIMDKIVFVGNVSDEALLALYSICEFFIMPTRKADRKVDGFGISYIEANACGKPVIGGRSGGVSDAVVDGVTGVLVNPEDVDEIAGAMIKLLNDKGYAEELGKNGLERVRKELTWKEIAAGILTQL